jgi:hypothetical protein
MEPEGLYPEPREFNPYYPLFIFKIFLILSHRRLGLRGVWYLIRTASCSLQQTAEHVTDGLYEVRQFNFRNGPMEENYAYQCTSGSCRLRNTPLMRLCTSRDDGAAGGNSLDDHFPEYGTLTSLYVGCQECLHILSIQDISLILECGENRNGLH